MESGHVQLLNARFTNSAVPQLGEMLKTESTFCNTTGYLNGSNDAVSLLNPISNVTPIAPVLAPKPKSMSVSSPPLQSSSLSMSALVVTSLTRSTWCILKTRFDDFDVGWRHDSDWRRDGPPPDTHRSRDHNHQSHDVVGFRESPSASMTCATSERGALLSWNATGCYAPRVIHVSGSSLSTPNCTIRLKALIDDVSFTSGNPGARSGIPSCHPLVFPHSASSQLSRQLSSSLVPWPTVSLVDDMSGCAAIHIALAPSGRVFAGVEWTSWDRKSVRTRRVLSTRDITPNDYPKAHQFPLSLEIRIQPDRITTWCISNVEAYRCSLSAFLPSNDGFRETIIASYYDRAVANSNPNGDPEEPTCDSKPCCYDTSDTFSNHSDNKNKSIGNSSNDDNNNSDSLAINLIDHDLRTVRASLGFLCPTNHAVGSTAQFVVRSIEFTRKCLVPFTSSSSINRSSNSTLQ